MHNPTVMHRGVGEDPILQIFRVAALHLLEADIAHVLGHTGGGADELILRAFWRFGCCCCCCGTTTAEIALRCRVDRCGGRIEFSMPDPLHFVHVPIAMMAAVRVGVGDALVRAEVPVEMPTFLRAAFLGGEKSSPAGVALVGLGIVERVEELGSKHF